MKSIIATTAIALSLTAPAFAGIEDARAHFAQSNNSAAERIIRDTTGGDTAVAERKVRLSKTSPAERNAPLGGTFAARADTGAAEIFFSMSNDSAAEIK